VSYQVFARKYRPQTFDEVVGQEHITRTLKNAIEQNRLAHAYLFVGPRGTGKTSTARILAKCLCCIHAPTTTPCGVCDPCREIAAGNSLDVLEIDGASNNGVEQVRELRDNVRYAPSRGAYRIYIIDEVHMLSSAAFNALLKTLEEPPEHVKFIFATTEPQKVLPTILSRCQRFDLRRIPAPLIAAHLAKIAGLEQIEMGAGAADAIARGAEGGLRDAESMLDQLVAFCGGRIDREDVLGIFGFTAPETVSQMSAAILARDASAALGVLDAQAEAGKDLLRLLGELIAHFRNLLVHQVNPQSTSAETGSDLARKLDEQAAGISADRLLELIDGFAAVEGRMKWAPNKKLHFEIGLIKAIQMLGQSTLTEVIDALTAIREAEPVNGQVAATPVRRDTASSAAVTTPAERGAPPASADASRLNGVVARRPEKSAAAAPEPESKAPPVVEPALLPTPVPATTPVTKAVTPAPSSLPAATPDKAPEGSAGEVPAASEPPRDGAEIWSALTREIRSQRPLITAWVQAGRVLGLVENTLRVAFPPAERMAIDSLSKPTTRKFLEGLLAKLAGRAIELKLEVLRDDPPRPAPLVPDAAETIAPARGLSAAEPAAVVASREPNGTGVSGNAFPPENDAAESFKNDPLIQKALKIFEGEIRSVERPA
jgi:DNA polymerase-3 subunit gamma/tau